MLFMSKKLIILLYVTSALATPTILELKTKNIEVNGKTSQVYTIEQPNGTWGYYGYKGESFDVIVKNDLNESTVIHWHGLILPNNQDGVELTQALIAPHSSYKYNFLIKNSGTYWMHSHFGFQEQKFAEAPLVIYDNKAQSQQNSIVLMLQDFSFKEPESIMLSLHHPLAKMAHDMPMTHDMRTMDMDTMDMPMDLNDVKYDAYLVNYRNLNNPQISMVKPGEVLRLRFINGAAMSNFWLNLGKLQGVLVAVDGSNVRPIVGNKFQIGMGNRLDILVTIPKKIGYFPILAQVEGTQSQTGIILTNRILEQIQATGRRIATPCDSSTSGAIQRTCGLNMNEYKMKLPKISSIANTIAPALNYKQELELTPLDKTSDISIESTNQTIKLVLAGNMQNYEWTINGQKWPDVTPIKVSMGNYVLADIVNNSMMSHPMHLHGYKFKVLEINGQHIKDGAIQDTILVMPHTGVKVVFIADNPGKWFFHCHSLYHMHSGMMAYIQTY